MIVTITHTAHADHWWPYVQPLLQPAIDITSGRYDAASVLAQLSTGKAQLWICWDKGLVAACVTQVVVYPTGKRYLSILFLGGKDMKKWLKMLANSLLDFSQRHRLADIEMHGRKGWLRLLKRYGFKANGTQLLEATQQLP